MSKSESSRPLADGLKLKAERLGLVDLGPDPPDERIVGAILEEAEDLGFGQSSDLLADGR